MLEELQIVNFKSWKDTGRVKLAPLTALFGANSSGKTSILQLLLMLKQTAQSPDRKRVLHTGDKNTLVDLGTYSDIAHNHQTRVPLKIRLSWHLRKALEIKDPQSERQRLFKIEKLTYESEIMEKKDRLVVKRFVYAFDGAQFGMQRRAGQEQKYELLHGEHPIKRTPGRAWPLPEPVKCYGFPDEAVGYFHNMGFLPELTLAFEDFLDSIAYLGPLREYPKRSYIWSGESPTDVGVTGGDAVPALLAAKADNLKSPRGTGRGKRYAPIEQRIVEWLQTMGLIHSFSLQKVAKHRKDYELRVKITETSAEVLLTDVGFGVSQILPVLVLCYYVPEGSVILLEHPEIHLHPAVQACLADVFIDVVNNRGVQIIVESHSEHFLRRLQRRIAEQEIGVDKTALYFCKIENGSSVMETLDTDMFGNISNWPQNFFGDEIGDLVAMSEAESKQGRPTE